MEIYCNFCHASTSFIFTVVNSTPGKYFCTTLLVVVRAMLLLLLLENLERACATASVIFCLT